MINSQCLAVQVDVLVELGLRVSVGPAVLLDAAKALDARKPADDDARTRAVALLAQLNALAYEDARGDDRTRNDTGGFKPAGSSP